MSDVLIASLFGLAVAFCWGCGSWLLARNSRKAPSLEINLSIQIPSFIIAICLLIFANPDLSNSKHILLIVLAHIIYGITYLLFIKALSLGPTGVVIPLQAIFPVYVLLFSIIFLGQKFIPFQIFSMILIVAGAATVAYEHHQKNNLRKLSVDKKLAILVGLLWGVGNTIMNSVVRDDVSWQTIYVVGNIFISFLALVFLMIGNGFKIEPIKRSLKNKTAYVTGIMMTAGTFAFYAGGTVVGSIVIIASIGAAESLVASLLSRVFDKEILPLHKRVGVVIIVSGIILLNLV